MYTHIMQHKVYTLMYIYIVLFTFTTYCPLISFANTIADTSSNTFTSIIPGAAVPHGVALAPHGSSTKGVRECIREGLSAKVFVKVFVKVCTKVLAEDIHKRK